MWDLKVNPTNLLTHIISIIESTEMKKNTS